MPTECPMCAGTGKILNPSLKQKDMSQKRKTAKKLYKEGYNMREIMVLMGYKSPRSIFKLIKL